MFIFVFAVILFGMMAVPILWMEIDEQTEVYRPNPRQCWKTEYILAIESHRPALFETACENLNIETWEDKMEFLTECENDRIE